MQEFDNSSLHTPTFWEFIMKVRHILLTVGLAAIASTSFAGELYHPSRSAEEGVVLHPNHSTSGLTRAQVTTNVMGAQRDGTLSWISRGYPGTYPLVSGPNLRKSRQQVLDELAAWQRNPVTPDGMRDVGGELGWVHARQAP